MNENILRQLGMGDYVDKIKEGMCPTCGKPINPLTFKDKLSVKEFTISGLCQECQDGVFR